MHIKVQKRGHKVAKFGCNLICQVTLRGKNVSRVDENARFARHPRRRRHKLIAGVDLRRDISPFCVHYVSHILNVQHNGGIADR
jgi:hypothetical protein